LVDDAPRCGRFASVDRLFVHGRLKGHEMGTVQSFDGSEDGGRLVILIPSPEARTAQRKEHDCVGD